MNSILFFIILIIVPSGIFCAFLALFKRFKACELLAYFCIVSLVIGFAIISILFFSIVIFTDFVNNEYMGIKFDLAFEDCIGLVTQVITFIGSTGLALGTFIYANSKKSNDDNTLKSHESDK